MKKSITKILSLALALGLIAGVAQPTSIGLAKKKKATVKSVKITNASALKVLYVKDNATVKVKVTVTGKASKKVTYKTSNRKIVSVTSKGKITAKSAGKATITVTSKANKKKKASVKIVVRNVSDEMSGNTDDAIEEEVNPVEAIAFSASTLTYSVDSEDLNDITEPYTISLGDEDSSDDNEVIYNISVSPTTFDVSKLSWWSSDNRVAMVSKNGTITLTGFGKATIKAYYGSMTASITINVVQDIDSGDDNDDDSDDSGDDGDDDDDGDFDDSDDDADE